MLLFFSFFNQEVLFFPAMKPEDNIKNKGDSEGQEVNSEIKQ